MARIFVCIVAAFFLNCQLAGAQQKDYEIKVISKNLQNVKGLLQKVGPEGIAIEDYKGNYLIFRVKDLVKITVRHRGLTVGKGAANGAMAGGLMAGGLLALDAENSSDKVWVLSAVIAAGATAIGTISGLVAEALNTKMILFVDGDQDRYFKNYKKLEKYIRIVPTERF